MFTFVSMKIRPNDTMCTHVQKFEFGFTFSGALNFQTPEFDAHCFHTRRWGDATTPPWTNPMESPPVLKWETWSTAKWFRAPCCQLPCSMPCSNYVELQHAWSHPFAQRLPRWWVEHHGATQHSCRKTLQHPRTDCLGGPPTAEQAEMQPLGVWQNITSKQSAPNELRHQRQIGTTPDVFVLNGIDVHILAQMPSSCARTHAATDWGSTTRKTQVAPG